MHRFPTTLFRIMNPPGSLVRRAFPIAVAAGLYVSAHAQTVNHVTVPQPGGMPVVPVITDIQISSNKATVSWENFCGPYRLLQKKSLRDSTWQVVAGPQLSNSATVATTVSNAFFRVSAPAPQYVGAQACAECHGAIHDSELATAHASAFQALKAIGQATNTLCLPCHTVGYGMPSGFVSEKKTPQLEGVQCENCHGPAALHAANENDLTVRPRVEIAAQLCGGCHMDSHNPQYNEWVTSEHVEVVEDMNPPDRINNCGRCHSGSARLALLKGQDPAVTVTGDANVAITCVVCHDPHHVTTNGFQLRNPIASTNYFSLSTSAVFTNKYDPNIGMCAQCHNDRGAAWTSSSRPPHHSPQYNLLLGTVGEVTNGITQYAGGHGSLITNQCVTCHMQTKDFESESSPAVSGHSFRVDRYDSCLSCHPFPEALVELTTDVVSNRIQEIKGELDEWATTKAPDALRTNYGVLSWEYTNPGELSSGTNAPTSDDQALVPDAIKKARFNLYLINNDGSYGIHNPFYSLDLLDLAEAWVNEAMNQ